MTENFNQEGRNQHQRYTFEEPSEILDDVPSEHKDNWTTMEKAAKLFSYVITFVVVLGGSMISKGTVLFMTAQLSHETKSYCNEELDENQELLVILPQEEKVAWTWTLAFVYFVPQVATFLRSSRILLFKNWNMPSALEFISVFLSESSSTIGNAILVFSVLPKLDSVKGSLVMICLSVVPATLSFSSNVISKNVEDKSGPFARNVYLDLLSIIIQGTGLILLTLLHNRPSIWYLPISAILISIGWWENYTNGGIIRNPSINATIKSSKTFPNSRYFSYTIISLWKCILFFGMMNFVEWYQYGNVDHLFSGFTSAFSGHDIIIKNVQVISTNFNEIVIQNQRLAPIWVLIISVTTTYFTYIFGKFACKINIQRISYAVPLHISGALTTGGLALMCAIYANNNCTYANVIPPYLFFNLPLEYSLGDLWLLVIWLLLSLSYALVTLHLWYPKEELLPSTEKIYTRPFYEPFLIDQDLGMNRKRLDTKYLQQRDEEAFTMYKESTIPKLYVCGTMWHETKEEMLTFLKSIVILDEDQCSRRIARNYLNSSSSNYYELETHIVFDDAFTRTFRNDQQPQVNDFVKDLIGCVDDAVSMVHKMDIKIGKPSKYSTPYGGRLEWILPGKTKLIAHLKDNDKIIPKKRWSQVMYLYYILGHRMAERDDIDNVQKEIIAENTYILAVDGDIHFRPQAIHMLLEHMKRDKKLAAACGRIHPVGDGIFAWYQKFEYAMSHWIYKASENITGCVLCCPGCFTIFRATALMSILKKLTTKSTKAVHFIKFDHGEDRWISTLLVLCGYKVGYVASSDAYTNCPEGFRELYNQRRRWIPSTTANVLDLLSKTHTVRKVNDSVSMLYMIYQTIFNIMTILGPSLVLWMLVNICTSTFKIDQSLSLLVNVIPVLIYIAICAYVTNEKVQIQAAIILCGIYTPIMCCFFVGSLFQLISNGFLSPWSLLFCFFLIQILVVGLSHPREIYYLKYLITYYVMIPTMHMVLFIYSVFNMHKVSWGTRELNKSLTPDVASETSWLEDESLQYGSTRYLSDTENMFWKKLLDKYLQPLDNIKEKAKINEDLREFRDKAISTLFLLNVMFLSIIYLLTSKNITLKWSLADVEGNEDIWELEVFNAILIIGISSLFFIQVVAIFIHRFGTFSQIMSSTKLLSKRDEEKPDPVAHIKKIQKELKGYNNTSTKYWGWQTLNTSLDTEQKNHVNTSDLEELFLASIRNGHNSSGWDNTSDISVSNEYANSHTNYGYAEI